MSAFFSVIYMAPGLVRLVFLIIGGALVYIYKGSEKISQVFEFSMGELRSRSVDTRSKYCGSRYFAHAGRA